MATQIFLLTPPNADPGTFPKLLDGVLAANPVAALLVRRHGASDTAYQDLVKAILPVAQAHACAILVDANPTLARTLGADGVHLPPDIKLVKAAIAALKPDFIVGIGPITTKHDAMSLGELNIDYLLFEPETPTDENAELAQWWTRTFEVPAVWSAPAAAPDDVATMNCEFVALSDSLWQHVDPVAQLRALRLTLEA